MSKCFDQVVGASPRCKRSPNLRRWARRLLSLRLAASISASHLSRCFVVRFWRRTLSGNECNWCFNSRRMRNVDTSQVPTSCWMRRWKGYVCVRNPFQAVNDDPQCGQRGSSLAVSFRGGIYATAVRMFSILILAAILFSIIASCVSESETLHSFFSRSFCFKRSFKKLASTVS